MKLPFFRRSGLLLLAIFVAAFAPGFQLSASDSDASENLAGALRSDRTREVFGGEKIEAVFHVIDARVGELQAKADLFQLAGSIAAPVFQDLAGTPGDLSGEVVRPWSFEFSLPEVRAETRFLLRLAVRETGEESWRVAGRLNLVAHPQNLLQPLVDFAQKHPVYLAKTFPQLHEFFSARDIATEPVDNIERAGSGLFFALESEVDPDSVFLHRDQVLVIFQTENAAPKLTLHPAAEGRILLAPQSLLDEADTHPRKQLEFLKIFDLAHRQLAPFLADPF